MLVLGLKIYPGCLGIARLNDKSLKKQITSICTTKPSFFYVGREVVHFQTVFLMNKNNQLWWLMHANTLSFTYPPYHPKWIARLCPSTNRSYLLITLNTLPCQSSSHHPRWHLLFLNLDVPQKHSGKYREKQCIHVKTRNWVWTNHGKFTAMILNL